MEGCIRIERMTNGFTVEMKDPAIVKANEKRDNNGKGPYIPYKDPYRKFVFGSEAEVLTFLKKNLKKAMPPKGDDYESSFDMASDIDD